MKQAQSKHYWIKSGILTILQNMSGVLFGFGGFYLLVRLLSKADFGAWTLFMSTVTIMETVRNGLIQSALVKFMSSTDEGEHNKIVSAAASIGGILTLVCIILSFACGPLLAAMWDTPQLSSMFRVFNLVFLFSGILMVFNCIEQANLNYHGIFMSTVVRQGIFFAYILAAFLLKFEMSLLSLIYVQILAAFVSFFVAGAYVRSHLRFRFQYTREWAAKLFNYGKYAFGTSVSSILSGTIDQMMLGALLSPMASGAFNVAVRIVNLIDIPTNALAVIVFPQSARRAEAEGPQAAKYLYEKSVGTILAFIIPFLIFIFFFADFVVDFIAGGKYADTVPLLKVTVFYCIFIPFGRQFGTVLDSIGKTKITFSIVVVTAATNLTLNYFFIRTFGVIGAAYATLISNIFGFAIAQLILYKELKVNPLNAFIYAVKFYPEFINKYLLKSKAS